MFVVDVCIVSGRRPGLLSETLESLSNRVFRHLKLGSVCMNLDPIFGDEADHAACVALFSARFPGQKIFEPETPGFAGAVQRLWSATTSDFVFHVEDDWIALRDIGEEIFEPFREPSIAQVSFHTAEKNWDVRKDGHLHRKRQYFNLAGIKIPMFRSIPIFTTSPSILRGDFARQCAALMDVTKDPEKQFYSGVNPSLQAFAASHGNYIFSPENRPVIKDIGRTWRDSKGIRKIIENSSSVWEAS